VLAFTAHLDAVAAMARVVARTKASWANLLRGDDGALEAQWAALGEACSDLRARWQGVTTAGPKEAWDTDPLAAPEALTEKAQVAIPCALCLQPAAGIGATVYRGPATNEARGPLFHAPCAALYSLVLPELPDALPAPPLA
jgi:hypothetical protein